MIGKRAEAKTPGIIGIIELMLVATAKKPVCCIVLKKVRIIYCVLLMSIIKITVINAGKEYLNINLLSIFDFFEISKNFLSKAMDNIKNEQNKVPASGAK